MKRFTVLLFVLCVTAISQAVMLADFETGLNGFVANANTTISQSTTAGTVTSGTYSLKIQQTAINYWGVTWQAPTVPAKLGLLQFDLSMIKSEWPNENWTRFAEKIALQSNGPGGGWFEIGTTAANWKWKDPSNTTVCPNDWQATYYDDVTKTCTIDISGYNLTGATYFNIVFSTGINPATTPFGAFYIDNVHFVDQPNTPNPTNGGLGIIDTTLSWANSTSSLNEVNVWFGIPPEPNQYDPNTILDINTYKTLLTKIYTEAAPGETSSCPMPSGLINGTKYTWCVDSDPNNFPVLFWTFTATTNNPPAVNAGDDKYIYTYADINNITITLTGSATDDGKVSPLTYAWTQTAGATATINSPTAAVTTVTLTGGLANNTEDGAGDPYVFQLVADDGQFTGSDTVTVYVNSDSCRASVENNGFYFYGDIAGPAGTGGANRDCKVDLYDFAEMAINWLNCSDTFEGCN